MAPGRPGAGGAGLRRGSLRRVLELYDLEQEVGEQQNLAAERPKLAAELARRLGEWRARVGAQMMEPDPEWNSK